MARFARNVVPGSPHHVMQRGNRRKRKARNSGLHPIDETRLIE
jgi:hypothetical protein